jgi:NADPH:quinone reductase-like Zn-dependent oxidoreductase
VNVVRRSEAVASLEALGGDVVLVDGPDLGERVAAATGKAKIRLGIDASGGSATDRIARSVAIGGTVVNYGSMSGEACKIAPASFVFRDVTLADSGWRSGFASRARSSGARCSAKS